MTLARRCNRKQLYLLYLELNKIDSTWLSHLNGKQGKVLGQVCDKEAHVNMCLKVGSIVFSDTTFVMDIKEALAAVSSVFLPLAGPVSGHWARSALVTGTRRAGGGIGNIIHYHRDQHSGISSGGAGCHLENSWEPDTGVTPSMSVVSNGGDQWNS